MNNSNRIIRKRVAIKLSGSIFSEERNEGTIKRYAEMLTDISIDVQPIVIAGEARLHVIISILHVILAPMKRV